MVRIIWQNRILSLILFIVLIIFFSCQSDKKLLNNPSSQKPETEFVNNLMERMTLEEKIGQLNLYTAGGDVTGPTMNGNYIAKVKAGRVGAVFNALSVSFNKELQRMAVEETRLGIPLLFGYDVIHGYRTIFPIPLAESCSWNLELMEKTAALAAEEAASAGINWTFSPMLDISRDPRWGRVAEGSGEDPFLGSMIARTRVKGYQGEDPESPQTILACVKHFAAYGAPVAGRDYATVDMSERMFRDVYLPPYQAAIEAGASTVMTAFNEFDGVPATANSYLLDSILRKEWGFDGFVVTDFNSIKELNNHGFSENDEMAAILSLNAGVDMDMQSDIYAANLMNLVKSNRIEEKKIDEAVRRILIMKYRLGLFRDPYLYLDEEREKATIYSNKILNHALASALESIVLLRNENYGGGKILPLSKGIKNLAIIGPMGKNKLDMLGCWHAAGDERKVTNLFEGIQEQVSQLNILYSLGCDFEGEDISGFSHAVKTAQQADVVILAMGENDAQNGEAASRSQIGFPGVQSRLIAEIRKTGKPTVLLVMAGRPIILNDEEQQIPAIINTWHLGTQGGRAIAQVLFGDYNPSGKLTMTIPRNEGQIPVFYSQKNTGRPYNPKDRFTTKYLDIPNEPLFPFGFGLSYTQFDYSSLQLSDSIISPQEELVVKVMVRNSGKISGEEVVQLYVRDLVGSVTRPIKELKGFRKILLEPGEIRWVSFTLKSDDLRFYNREMKFVAEPGAFMVYAGTNSAECLSAKFNLIP